MRRRNIVWSSLVVMGLFVLVVECLALMFLCGRLYEQHRVPERVIIKYEQLPCPYDHHSWIGPDKMLHRYIEFVARTSAYKHGVDPELVLSVMWQESRWKPLSVSKKGAMGLMQLMPATANWLGVDNPYGISANIDGGVRYLKWLQQRRFSNKHGVLMAYNWGIGNVRKYEAGKIKSMPKETALYVRKVNSHMITKPWMWK